MAIRYQQGQGFEILPQGNYDFEVKKVTAGTSSGGHPQLTVDFEVADGDLAGRRHREWITLSENSGWRLSNLAKACGVSETDTGEKDSDGKAILALEEQDLVGTFVTADITHRMYDGKNRANMANEKPSTLGANAVAPSATGKAPDTTTATAPAAGTAAGAPAVAPRRPRPAAS